VRTVLPHTLLHELLGSIVSIHTYHMAWTDTGLNMCILPAVLTLNPLKRKTKGKTVLRTQAL
jgi:hypothetical protein